MSLAIDPRRPVKRIPVAVYEDDIEYLSRELCAGERGMLSDTSRVLLSAFVRFLKDKNLQNYIESNGSSLENVRRILSVIQCDIKPKGDL